MCHELGIIILFVIVVVDLIVIHVIVTVAQSTVNWHNTHTHVDRTHSLTHLNQYSYNHVVRSASSTITEIRIIFLF